MSRRILVIALIALLGGAWYLGLPPRLQPGTADTQRLPGGVQGAIHVHTTRSDGTGSVDEVAAAAAAAGLDFVVFTDHGDGSREPDPPQYRSGVLCIDAVEISTYGGHIVALGLPTSPYPLRGEARDVLDDIARMGGFAVAAHPGSAKPELRWSDWALPIDGIEWLNGDSEWRDESRWSLVRALLSYPARGVETLASILDRPDAVLQQWDRLTQQRRVVALAAADAHARIGVRSLGEPYDTGASLHAPSYERTLSVFSNVLPDTAFTGDAAADAALVLDAIRAGRVYSRIDAIGAGTLRFAARSGEADLGGDVVRLDSDLVLRAAVDSDAAARIALLKNGEVVATGEPPHLDHRVDGMPGVYRVEVSLPGAPGEPPVPWILSNPIYVGRTLSSRSVERRAAASYAVQYAEGDASRWSVETSPASRAALDVVAMPDGNQLALRYALGGSTSDSAFAAFVMSSGGSLAEYDRLVFTAHASAPMRLSVQLRVPEGIVGERWHRSVFVDTMPREITVDFDDLRPIGPTRAEQPVLAGVESVLFVVDTVNTPLGANGRIWIDNVRYGR